MSLHQSPADLTRLNVLRQVRNLDALVQMGEDMVREIEQGDTSAIPLLCYTAGLLNTLELGTYANQKASLYKLVKSALESSKQLSVEEEIKLLSHLPPTPPLEHGAEREAWARQCETDTSLWLRVANRLSSQIDPTFDPSDVPQLNIVPPANAGLPAGVAPDAIADPDLRAEYEAAIAANHKKAERYQQQTKLRRLYESLQPQLGRYILRAGWEQADDSSAETSPLPSLTVDWTPEDNFPGRSKNRFGIGEAIYLSTKSTSVPLLLVQSTRLRWFREAGSGTLSFNYDGEAIYFAGSVEETAILALKIISGREKGKTVLRLEIVTVAPTGAYMQQQPNTGIKHQQNTWSVGFKGEIFLTPNNVSYAGVNFREGSVDGVGTGWLSSYNGLNHPVGQSHTITGNKVNCVDTVYTGEKAPPPPYAAGDFRWAIPWQYQQGTGTWTNFTTANHHETSDASGKATIEKKGAGPFSKNAGDPTSNY